MGLRRNKSETAALRDTVDSLPRRVAEWTPEQRQQYNTQSDRAMREQNGVDPNAG